MKVQSEIIKNLKLLDNFHFEHCAESEVEAVIIVASFYNNLGTRLLMEKVFYAKGKIFFYYCCYLENFPSSTAKRRREKIYIRTFAILLFSIQIPSITIIIVCGERKNFHLTFYWLHFHSLYIFSSPHVIFSLNLNFNKFVLECFF